MESIKQIVHSLSSDYQNEFNNLFQSYGKNLLHDGQVTLGLASNLIDRTFDGTTIISIENIKNLLDLYILVSRGF